MRPATQTLVVCLLLARAFTQPALRHSGVVRSAGQPIPGATVTAIQGDRKVVTSTDDAGRYEFANLSPGAWKFEVEMTGFVSSRRDAEAAAALEWALQLQPRVAAAKPATPAGPSARGAGFRNVAVTQSASDAELQAEIDRSAQTASAPMEASANEALLLNGSISGGLQSAIQESFLMERRGEFEAMRAGGGFPGAFGPGGPGGPGEGSPFGGGLPGSGEGGPGGGEPGAPGMRGAAGPGGAGGGPGGRGGFGGPGGPGGPGGRGGMGAPGGGGGFGGRGGFGGGGGMGPGGRGGPQGRGGGPPFAAFGNRAGRGRQPMRGMANYTMNNSALNARSYSLTGQTVEKPSYAQNRFGFTIGGPLNIPKIVHSERTFLFINYNGSRGRNLYNATSTLPSALERVGDFSQSVVRGPVAIFDPSGRLPFAGNRIPANRMNSASRGLLDFIPLPNQPGAVQNYQYVTSVKSGTDNLGVRLNRTLTQKNRIDANFNAQFRRGNNAQLFGFLDATDGHGYSWNLGWVRTFARGRINTLRWNFSRNISETLPFFAYGRNVAADLGILGVSDDPINYGPPNLSFTNFGSLNDASPVLRRDQTSSVSDSFLYVYKSHTVTFGGELRRMQLNTRTDQNARGTMTFSGLATSDFNAAGQPVAATGFDFADFLLGLPQSTSVRFGSSSTYFRSTVYSAFAQDDWRAHRSLTLNLGVRYEYFTPFHEKFGRIANLDVAPGFTGVAVVTPGAAGPYSGVFPDGLVDPDKNNISPRVGIAWRPSQKRRLQVRAGFGLFFNGSMYNQFPSRLAAQPPFANTASVNTSATRVLTIQNGFATSPSQTITNTYAVDRRYRIGYAQTWNASISQPVGRSWVTEISYLATKGTRLDIQRLPNRAAPGSPLTAEQRRQIGNAVGFTFDSSEGNSISHAGQARLTRRFARGVSSNLTYTYAKSIDNASTLGGGGATVAQNDRDLAAERGRSSFDQRHALSLSYVLNSPVSENAKVIQMKGLPLLLMKDWSLSGGLTASSGTPLTARVLGNQADTGGTGSVGSGRADATGAPVDAGSGFFNLGAFTIPAAGFGNAGRNTIDGPSRFSMNLSLARSFRVDERRRLEFRADSNNFLNHVSYTGLGTVVNALNYGLPTSAAGMRTVTMTMRLRF